MAIMMANVLAMNAAKKTVINRIEPTNWYVGMKNPTVQLMVYGQGIRDVGSVTTDYPGVTIDSLVRLDSPNYLLIYLNLHDAQPGTMTLNFDKTKVTYQLKAREKKGEERMGFTNADVLYMLMPDRFAQGANHPKQIKGMRSYVEDRSKPSLRHGGDLNGIREHLVLPTQTTVSPPITAMPPPIIIRWIPALAQTMTTNASATRLMPRV